MKYDGFNRQHSICTRLTLLQIFNLVEISMIFLENSRKMAPVTGVQLSYFSSSKKQLWSEKEIRYSEYKSFLWLLFIFISFHDRSFSTNTKFYDIMFIFGIYWKISIANGWPQYTTHLAGKTIASNLTPFVPIYFNQHGKDVFQPKYDYTRTRRVSENFRLWAK